MASDCICFSVLASNITFLPRGKPILLPTILQLLNEELRVDAKVDKNNVGRVRVSGSSIDKFIERRRFR